MFSGSDHSLQTKSRSRRGITAITIAILALGLLAGTASAAAPKTQIGILSCSEAYVDVFEDVNDGGDGLRICFGANQANLANLAHTPAGQCAAAAPKLQDDWNDCISSARFQEGSLNTSVCFFTGANYAGSKYKLNDDNQGVSWYFGTFADSITSIKFGATC